MVPLCFCPDIPAGGRQEVRHQKTMFATCFCSTGCDSDFDGMFQKNNQSEMGTQPLAILIQNTRYKNDFFFFFLLIWPPYTRQYTR